MSEMRYPSTWKEVRRLIKLRDVKYGCPLCNEDDRTMKITVHHTDHDRGNSNPTELILLHMKCHNKISTKEWNAGVGRDILKEYFLSILKIRAEENRFSFCAYNRKIRYYVNDRRKSSLRK